MDLLGYPPNIDALLAIHGDLELLPGLGIHSFSKPYGQKV